MTGNANGTFEVKVSPQGEGDKTTESAIGRLTIDKQYHGDLEGSGEGRMLTASTPVKDSAGYVAIERVSGALQGRKGSFLLQHTGTMNRGAQRLSITVVPDSGTDELTGITGEMTIKIEDGKHSYGFGYTLPDII